MISSVKSAPSLLVLFKKFVDSQLVNFRTTIESKQREGQRTEPEPEQEFLANSATMAHYATQEMKQFLRWTGQNSPQHDTAQNLMAELERITTSLNALQHAYRQR